jgi:hypothetical protein
MTHEEHQKELSEIETNQHEEKEILEDDTEDKNEPKIKEPKSPVQLSDDRILEKRVNERNKIAREKIEELEQLGSVQEEQKKSGFNWWLLGGAVVVFGGVFLSKKIKDDTIPKDTQYKKELVEAPKMETAKDFLS